MENLIKPFKTNKEKIFLFYSLNENETYSTRVNFSSPTASLVQTMFTQILLHFQV